MSFYAAGVNHISCPIESRERLSALGSKAAARAFEARGWSETVVLSTCNRFEVYAAGPAGGGMPLESLVEVLRELSGSSGTRHIYRYCGEPAVRHLFRVASGLDSLVLGETEILGQVKHAYEEACAESRTRKRTNVLFQRSLFVGKAVRTRTNISMGQVSVASVAVELAKRIFGRLSERAVLILGAGEIAEKTARHLKSAKADRLSLANRTWDKAAALAKNLSAEAVPREAFPRKLAEADVVIASTGAVEPVLTRPMLEAAIAKRGGRPLFIIDIAMPRDVSPDVHELEGIYLYDLEDLKSIVDENFSQRSDETLSAEAIIRLESTKLGAWLDALSAGRELSLRHSDLAGMRSRSSPAAACREAALS